MEGKSNLSVGEKLKGLNIHLNYAWVTKIMERVTLSFLGYICSGIFTISQIMLGELPHGPFCTPASMILRKREAQPSLVVPLLYRLYGMRMKILIFPSLLQGKNRSITSVISKAFAVNHDPTFSLHQMSRDPHPKLSSSWLELLWPMQGGRQKMNLSEKTRCQESWHKRWEQTVKFVNESTSQDEVVLARSSSSLNDLDCELFVR